MSANNENLKIKELEDQLKQSDVLKGVITEQIKDAAKHNEEVRMSIKEKDPYGVHSILDALDSEKSEEGRDYQGMIDMSHRVRDWLECNGTFFSDKVQKTVKMSFKDAVHSKDMAHLFPKVVSNIVLEHMAPTSNILGLYESIRFQNGTSISFPVWSAGGSSVNLYVGEEGEPNELTADMSSMVHASTGKTGIKASISEEALKYSVIDLYKLQLKWCGIAMGRFKERLAVENLFNATKARALFDNTAAGAAGSQFGNTNGCDRSGNRNGTLSSYDLFEAYTHGLAQGSDLNTIIIHPLGWRALANNSILRDKAATNGGRIWEGPQGGSPSRNEVGSGLQKGMFNPGYGTQKVGANNIATDATTFSGTISVLGQPFNVITSPFAPIRKAGSADINSEAGVQSINGKYVCDFLMIDPRDVGYHIIDETLYTREEDRLFKQIKETAFFERYGFGSANQGVGLYRFNSVVATEGYDFLAAPVTLNTNGVIAPQGTLSV